MQGMANHTSSRSSPSLQSRNARVPAAYENLQRDIPGAELHLLDIGHFALEDKLDEMEAADPRLP
jgi:hypothetical protein